MTMIIIVIFEQHLILQYILFIRINFILILQYMLLNSNLFAVAGTQEKIICILALIIEKTR